MPPYPWLFALAASFYAECLAEVHTLAAFVGVFVLVVSANENLEGPIWNLHDAVLRLVTRFPPIPYDRFQGIERWKRVRGVLLEMGLVGVQKDASEVVS